jgi:hypothetical protein
LTNLAIEHEHGDCRGKNRGNGFRFALTIHLSKVIRISQRLQEINSVRCYLWFGTVDEGNCDDLFTIFCWQNSPL